MIPGMMGAMAMKADLAPETVQSLPAMTSNTAPAGHVATRNSIFSSTYEAWKAFDQNPTGTAWISANGFPGGYLQRQVPSAIIVLAYRLICNVHVGAAAMPRTFNLQGSNDGSVWDTLDSRVGEPDWSNTETREYLCASFGSYSYYRLNGSNPNGTNYIGIGELELLQPE